MQQIFHLQAIIADKGWKCIGGIDYLSYLN